jgi:hypothetical protein
LKAKTDELETNSNIKNIRDLYRGINDFKKGYQPRTNIVKDEKGYLVTESYSIVGRWRNHFSQLFHVHGFSNVMQTQIHRGRGASWHTFYFLIFQIFSVFDNLNVTAQLVSNTLALQSELYNFHAIYK